MFSYSHSPPILLCRGWFVHEQSLQSHHHCTWSAIHYSGLMIVHDPLFSWSPPLWLLLTPKLISLGLVEALEKRSMKLWQPSATTARFACSIGSRHAWNEFVAAQPAAVALSDTSGSNWSAGTFCRYSRWVVVTTSWHCVQHERTWYDKYTKQESVANMTWWYPVMCDQPEASPLVMVWFGVF